MTPFDVVIVPDFTNRWARGFEVRTLFFLGAWADYAGAARDFPLHIACIGEPPESIHAAARRYGASITSHAPVGIGSVMSNKLRGFEADLNTSQILLLDVDVIPLGDISPLGELNGSIAALPIGKPPLRMRDWRIAYDLLGLDLPEERIASMFGDLIDPELEHLRSPEQNERLRKMMPMYQGGVVFAPVEAGLRDAWAEAYRIISTTFPDDDPESEWIRRNDEVPLVGAVQKLRLQGVPFQRLPDMYHAQWPHMWGRYGWGDPRLFHLMGIHRLEHVPLDREALSREIATYCAKHRQQHLEGDNRYKVVVRQDPESFTEFTNKLEESLLDILDTHVMPAISVSSAAGVMPP